ncbi:neoverrucotoxin subunit beta-like [Neoarius graeffei]|uniref:neoverrucotoxin subunit beta-like n=1 Tax=Neoarius graeffei TaxID=443677 RepID=UPI00298C914F|nr:neoverrucotoxin subunit beta-like [Neoarius graeffei]
MDSKCMEIPALGRSLYPGMLYDCRRDSFIPGVTLWDAEAVNKHIDVHQQPKTQLKFTGSDTLSEKTKLLDISASLKASFFCGLVEVGGSAKYLNDTKSSTHQCRVTMQYSQTTEFKQLTMKNLGNITYPQVFDQKTATHVVTAVLYGAQAFMVFDHTAAENERKQVVEGNLHAVVKKIPTISIEGEASLKMTEEEKTLSENISVTFYGDVALEENPTTYKEALEVYKKLPTLMKKENYKGVPLTVWLYPLMLLDDKAARLVREISMTLVNKTENLLEEFGEVERRCNDVFKNQMTDDFSDVKDRLLKFGDLHSCYKTTFQKALSRVLPAIRGGTQEGKALEDILNFHDASPFNARNVNKWLDNITTELNILSSYTSGLKNLTVVNSPATLRSILFDPENDVVVCLSFTSLKFEDSYLAALQDFKSSEGFRKFEQTSERIFSCQVPQPWFTSPDVSESMRQNLSHFTSFSKANKNEKGIKFIIASISDPSNPGNSIQLYQKGHLTDPKFQPVSKPPLPVVETSDGKVILKLSKSPTGKMVQFRVEYRMTPPIDSAEDADEWTVTDTSDAQPSFTLTGLKPANQYWVRYRAVSDVGVSEASDSVSFTFHGNPEVTVSQWDFTMPSLFKKLRTNLMTSMGLSRWSASTIKSEVTNIHNSPMSSRSYK